VAAFDVYVKKIAEYTDEMRNGRQVREVQSLSKNPLSVRVGGGAQPGVILKEDTFVELGSPVTASAAFLLWTEDASIIDDGRIILVGPDIPESEGKSLPFGQVIIAGGAGMDEKNHKTLEWSQNVSDRIEGYMIRSVPQRVWSRVSRAVAEKGFCFETLGRALMGIIRAEVPALEAIEVLFVTSSKEDVEKLDNIGRQVEKITREIKRGQFVIEDDGAYVCTTGLDCSVCIDKEVCDTIREVVALRKARAG
jgi:CO dehydrogenase/acetyl-CoA synthase beta subunit